MSFENTFNLINSELSHLKNLFEEETNILKQRNRECLAELGRLNALHGLERHNWEESRNVFQQNLIDLESELTKITDSIPREKEFLECLPHIAFICSIDGKINYANQAFYSFFDLENLDSGWFPFGRASLDSAKVRGSWAREIDLISKNGKDIKVDAKLFSWNNYSGDIAGFIGITIDRTQLIELELEKQKLKQELCSVNMLLSAEIISEKKAGKQKELRCIIFGDSGSGKSALINELIGEKLLPEGKVINIPIRCGRGAEKAIIAHFWNGERQCFYRDKVTAECIEILLMENSLLWLELRNPGSIIPYNIMLEEASEISENIISKADAFIFLTTIRNYPSYSALNKMQNFLREGAYGIFAISKIDLECDDYECEKIVLSVASKIKNAIKQIKRILRNYPALENCQILPVSTQLKMNIDLIVWHLEEAVSSYQVSIHHSPTAKPFSLPEKDENLPDNPDILAPMLKAFHEQEFQAEFIRFIKLVSRKSDSEKINCLFISPHRESVKKLVARLAHDISFMHVLDGIEENWIANFDDIKYTKILVPDSILAKINFIIAPEKININEDEWNILLEDCIPVIILELTGSDYGIVELESVACKACVAALKKKSFCVISGEGLMINSIEIISKNINEWADCNVPLFIYENYDVIMRSVGQ
jgi:GTPase SAR1 family protein/PAS domain-containing protein